MPKKMTPESVDPAGVAHWKPKRNLEQNLSLDGAPTKVSDFYDGRFEKISGKSHLTGKGKLK